MQNCSLEGCVQRTSFVLEGQPLDVSHNNVPLWAAVTQYEPQILLHPTGCLFSLCYLVQTQHMKGECPRGLGMAEAIAVLGFLHCHLHICSLNSDVQLRWLPFVTNYKMVQTLFLS